MAHNERGSDNGQYDKQGQQGPGAFELAGLGMMNVGCLLSGGALGWLIDSRLETTPVFILTGIAVGIVLGVIGSYQKVRKYLND